MFHSGAGAESKSTVGLIRSGRVTKRWIAALVRSSSPLVSAPNAELIEDWTLQRQFVTCRKCLALMEETPMSGVELGLEKQ